MVRWTLSAKRGLASIYAYIAGDSVYYAKKVVDDIVSKSVTLSEFPFMGREVEEVNHKNIREIIVYSYRMIYKVVHEEVIIIALVHCKMKLTEDMLDN